MWDRFASEPIELPRTAKAIRQLVTKREIPIADQDEEEDFAEAEEGRILTRLHRSCERSHELVARKKASTLKVHGRLQCEACSFDFETQYGLRGSGFIAKNGSLRSAHFALVCKSRFPIKIGEPVFRFSNAHYKNLGKGGKLGKSARGQRTNGVSEVEKNPDLGSRV